MEDFVTWSFRPHRDADHEEDAPHFMSLFQEKKRKAEEARQRREEFKKKQSLFGNK